MPKYVIRSRKLTSHISGGLRSDVLLEVDRRANAAGVSRARYLGEVVRARVDELDAIAERSAGPRRIGPFVTIAATVGVEVHRMVKDAAKTHGVAVSRLVAAIVDDELEG